MDELQNRGPGRPPKYTEVKVEALPQRPPRKPFGSLEQKLAYPPREGYHRHWFNDAGNRIARAIEAGYEHVKDSQGKPVSKAVGVAENGGPLIAFVMEIPQEWYDADMKEQQDQIDARESAIKDGTLESQKGDGRYVPAQGISIKHGR